MFEEHAERTGNKHEQCEAQGFHKVFGPVASYCFGRSAARLKRDVLYIQRLFHLCVLTLFMSGCSRSTPNEQAINMNNARPRASIRYSGQWRLIASAALLLD